MMCECRMFGWTYGIARLVLMCVVENENGLVVLY